MIAKYLFPAVAAIGSAAAQCTQSTATINAPADATGLSNCRTFKGTILVASTAAGNIDLSGIGQIDGDLIVNNASAVTGLSSSTINAISGTFTLHSLIGLSSLSFLSLTQVGTIDWQTLPKLPSLTFGTPGVTKASSVTIADTFLSSLAGIDVASVGVIDINNNAFMTQWSSNIVNVTGNLKLLANGFSNFAVSLPKLTSVQEMSISTVGSWDAPALKTIGASASFISNTFTSFTAPNLTSTSKGDITFVNNTALTNISFPQLTSTGGSLQIAANDKLGKVDGFPNYKSVGGSIKIRGNMNEVSFPALNDVKGVFNVSSSADINGSCTPLAKLAPTKQGGNNKIQGGFTCKSNDQNSNSDTDFGSQGGNGTGGGSGGGGNSAAGVAINSALLSLAVIGGLVALL